MNSDSERLLQVIVESMSDQTFRSAVFSKPSRRERDQPSRVDVRPVEIRGTHCFQFTYRHGNQETHQNRSSDAATEEIHDFAGRRYRDCRVVTATDEWLARYNRRGICSLKRRPLRQTPVVTTTHNNARRYLIPEGQPVPFLVETGIMTTNGQVRAKHFSKFRQINRFVEFIRDIVGSLPENDVIHIVDFGCGKSYLTFATHYFLTHILSRSVKITGLDQRTDVVATCCTIAERLGLSDLTFRAGDIAGFKPEEQIHLAISLHACDTATDDALAVAAAWKSNVILAVPCCQHEFASKLNNEQWPLMSEHGILHERFSSLATDAVRANLLECIGYRTQVLEFIDTEHTPKNLLIRAVRRDRASESGQNVRKDRMNAFSEQFSLPPLRLQQKLEEYGLLQLQRLSR